MLTKSTYTDCVDCYAYRFRSTAWQLLLSMMVHIEQCQASPRWSVLEPWQKRSDCEEGRKETLEDCISYTYFSDPVSHTWKRRLGTFTRLVWLACNIGFEITICFNSNNDANIRIITTDLQTIT